MNQVIVTVAKYLFCVGDLIMLYCFFRAMFRPRYDGPRLTAWFLLVSALEFWENSFHLSWLNLLMLPFLCFLFVIVAFRISVRNGVAYTLVFYAIFAGGEAASELPYRFLEANFSVPIAPWFTCEGLFYTGIDYVLRFLFLWFIGRYTKGLEVDRDRAFSWYLLIIPTASMTVLSCFAYIDFPESILLQGMMCCGAILLYLSNAAIFIILERYTGILNRIKYEEMYQIRQTMEDDKFRNIEKLNENYRCYMHDMHSYLGNLRMLALDGENQKIVSIIDDMEGSIEHETKGIMYCGHKVLNAILSERSARAKSKKIRMDIFVEKFLDLDFISDTDMISMFGNLLDNALEAAERCEEGKRHVSVKIFMGNQYMLVLYIENRFRTAAARSGERLLSTKEDTSIHGLGIGIVQKLAEKYGGALSLKEKDDLFTAVLSVSVSKK